MDNKLLVIIVAVLVVVSIGLSAISLITIMSLRNQMVVTTEELVEPGEGVIEQLPLSQIDIFNFSDNFIFTFTIEGEAKRVDNVVCSIAVGLDNKSKKFDDILVQFTDKEKIIRAELEKVIKAKTASDFTDPVKLSELETEVIVFLRTMLDTEVVVDVYFTNVLTSSK